jgi:hypothetical protein
MEALLRFRVYGRNGGRPASLRRHGSGAGRGSVPQEDAMGTLLKFIGGTVGLIFLIGLAVVILVLALLF